MNGQLDSFESALLDELRAVVAERAEEPPPAAALGRRRSGASRRVLLIAAAVAAGGLVLALPTALSTPAYAVQGGPSGDVSVHIDRLEDAAGLQAALRKLGVGAQIQYLGDGMRCAPDRYAFANTAPNSRTRFRLGSNGIWLTLDRRDVSDGQTVVIAASRIKDGVYGEMGIALGPVKPCNPTPLRAP